MEHPLVGSLLELTDEEISAKIAELGRKLNMAMQMGNFDLCNQIRLALANFQAEYQNRLTKSLNTPFDEVIDIS